MGFERLLEIMRKHGYVSLLLQAIMIFAGLNLVLIPPKMAGVQYIGVILFLAGIGLLASTFVPVRPAKEEREPSLSERLMALFTFEGKLIPFFWVIGAIVIALDLLYNALLAGAPGLGTHDTVVLLFGAAMIIYSFLPEDYGRERDFVLIFSIGLLLILVFPLMLMRLLVGSFDASVNAYSSVLLSPELGGILTLLGIENSVDGIILSFVTQAGEPVSLMITTSCSGIYSFSIFASAFSAFVLTEYSRFDKRVGFLLVLGVLTSYLANLLRMVIIVLVGWSMDTPETGLQNLLNAHANAGWMIFLLWITIFWLVMYKFLMVKEERTPRKKEEAVCGICGKALTPAIPAVRCECGTFYHVDCIEEKGFCPVCKRPYPIREPDS